jgi:hypothetical protein
MYHRPEVAIAHLNAGDFIEPETGFLLLRSVAREAMFLEKWRDKLLEGVVLGDYGKWTEKGENERARNPSTSIRNQECET